MAKDEDILEEAKEAFQAAEVAESDNRTEAENDLEFARLGKQWSQDDIDQRVDEGRPCLTINLLPKFIRQVVNETRQNTPSITVRPVDGGADIETAEVMSGLIRDIQSQSNAEIAYETGSDFAVSCGFGFWRVNLAYADDFAFDQDIRIDGIRNPFSVYGDPYEDGPDSANWNCAFVLDKLKRSAFEKRFKGKDLVPWDDARWDTVKSESWRKGDEIGYAEYWKREPVTKTITLLTNGEIIDLKLFEKNLAMFQAKSITPVGRTRDVQSHKVTQYLLTACDVLETTPWAGRYIPIVPVYGEDINVAGERYLRSLIRDAKDPQRIHNYMRTTATEVSALAPKAPYIGEKGAFAADSRWETAHKVSHPYLEYAAGKKAPERQPFTGVPSGLINEAAMAADDMKNIMGIYDASLGQRSNETSGRAIALRQKEGDVGTFHFQDNVNRAVKHTGRILLDLIPHVYNTERVIRVLGEDKKTKMVKLGEAPQLPEGQKPPKGIERIYDLSMGRYDLAVEAGHSFTTQRQEAAEQMMELIRVYPDAAPIIGDLIAEKLDWPGATEIARRLKMMLPPNLQTNDEGEPGREGQPADGQPQQPAIPPELLQAIEEGKQMIADLQQQLTDTKGELDQTKADNWAAAMKVRIDAFNAQTNRMKVTMAPIAPDPLEVPAEASLQA